MKKYVHYFCVGLQGSRLLGSILSCCLIHYCCCSCSVLYHGLVLHHCGTVLHTLHVFFSMFRFVGQECGPIQDSDAEMCIHVYTISSMWQRIALCWATSRFIVPTEACSSCRCYVSSHGGYDMYQPFWNIWGIHNGAVSVTMWHKLLFLCMCLSHVVEWKVLCQRPSSIQRAGAETPELQDLQYYHNLHDMTGGRFKTFADQYCIIQPQCLK